MHSIDLSRSRPSQHEDPLAGLPTAREGIMRMIVRQGSKEWSSSGRSGKSFQYFSTVFQMGNHVELIHHHRGIKGDGGQPLPRAMETFIEDGYGQLRVVNLPTDTSTNLGIYLAEGRPQNDQWFDCGEFIRSVTDLPMRYSYNTWRWDRDRLIFPPFSPERARPGEVVMLLNGEATPDRRTFAPAHLALFLGFNRYIWKRGAGLLLVTGLADLRLAYASLTNMVSVQNK